MTTRGTCSLPKDNILNGKDKHLMNSAQTRCLQVLFDLTATAG